MFLILYFYENFGFHKITILSSQAPGMGFSNPLPGQLMPPTVEVLSQPAALTPAGLADQVLSLHNAIFFS